MKNYISNARLIFLGLTVALLPFSIRFCNLALLIFLLTCLLGEKKKVTEMNILAWLLPAFFLLHVIGTLYSENTLAAWSDVDKKLTFLFVPLIVAIAAPFDKDGLKKIMWVFAGSCLTGTLVCIIRLNPDPSDFWSSVSYIHLAEGMGMHPTYLSLYLLICILIVLKTIEKKWIAAVLTIYILIFIVFLSSRIILLATVVTLIAAAPRKRFVIIAVAVTLIATMLNPLTKYRNYQEYTPSNFSIPPAEISDNPISIRVSLLWLSAKAIGQVNPVIGTGTGDVEKTISSLADEYNVHNVLNTSDPHNQYIHTYIALGAIGLIFLVATFAIPMVIFFQKREYWLCAGLLIFMAVCLTESVLERHKGIVLFCLFVGLNGNQLRAWRPTETYQKR